MHSNVPIASYTELLKRRLKAVRALTYCLRESQNALLERDSELSGSFTEQQSELCNEIEYLDRDLRSADEILEWAKALKPNTKEIRQLRSHMKAAESGLAQSARVHSGLVRRAKRSVTIMMNMPSKAIYNSPSSHEAFRRAEEA